jgi:hypothetical protein
LRNAIEQFTGGATRLLLVCADATFTNRTVLRDLPPRTTLIGRAKCSPLCTACRRRGPRGLFSGHHMDLAVLSPNMAISEIALTGSVCRIAGSDDESGTAILK